MRFAISSRVVRNVGASLLAAACAFLPACQKNTPATATATATAPAGELTTYQRELRGDTRVMGTWAALTVVAGKNQSPQATKTLDEVEALLRGIEVKMSSRLADSELSKLNTAPVGQASPLSAETLGVLREARAFTPLTNGAFDVTCRPILELWRVAGQRKTEPTADELRQAVESTGWRWFELTDVGAIRKREGASIDLGGIAKKYAIDQAAELLIRRGVAGGLVNVGGDMRCVGRRASGGPWHISVRNPFSDNPDDQMALLAVEGGAVCTSGNYERFVEIAGRRHSHIVDPRTGQTCDNAPSVTVVGPDATSAGLWATALSVLGLEGLKLMPRDAGLEVMMVVGQSPEDSRWYRTPGFDKFFLEKPAMPPTELPPGLSR